jgi:carboxylesterase type B
VNFARSGNPNGKGLATWPAYRDQATGRAMMLGDAQRVKDEDASDAARWALYDALYTKQLSAK